MFATKLVDLTVSDLLWIVFIWSIGMMFVSIIIGAIASIWRS